MIEIERKFLVKSQDFKSGSTSKTLFIQGYLNTDPERSIRIRIQNKSAYLTIKGKSNASGLSRYEWEKEIPQEEAKELLNLCEPGIIEKYRYLVPVGGHIFEVDEFLGNNEGLILAEIELKSENEYFQKPKWLGEEVTGNIKYYNSYLSKMKNSKA